MGRARRLAAVTLVLVVAGAAISALLPASIVAVRVSGVTAAWWLWSLALAAAALAGALALVGRAGGGQRPAHPPGAAAGDLGGWATPALLVSVAGLVFTGAATAPLVATAALVAPLLGGLLSGRDGLASAGIPERLAAPITAALLIAAQLLVAADLAVALGVRRVHGIAAAAALLIAAAPTLAGRRRRHAVAVAGALAVSLGVGLVGVRASMPPWTAWNAIASRPALAFSDRAPAVTRGVDVRTPSTLRFSEAQRVTALTGGVYRVLERDGGGPMMREWRLDAGESLAVRSGDALVLPVGARVRFEAGKRVPGAPDSGAAWGESRPRAPLAALATFAGAALTLAGLGAGGTSGGGAAGAGAGLLLVAASVAWGLYAALAGADVALGTPMVGSLLEAAHVLAPPAARPASALLVIGCAALLGAAAPGLRGQVARAMTAAGSRVLGLGAWGAVLTAAVIVALLEPVGAWRALALGAGLAASVSLAPRLVATARGRAAAGSAGGLAFVVTAIAGGAVSGGASIVADYPGLVAVPVAWAAGWLVDGDGGAQGAPPSPPGRRAASRDAPA